MPCSDADECLDYLRRAESNTRNAGTARIDYRRTQSWREPGEAKPERRMGFGRVLTSFVPESIRKSLRDVAFPYASWSGNGVIDFAHHRCYLNAAGFEVLLDGHRGLVKTRTRWEEDAATSDFMAVGGPLWLFELVRNAASCERVLDTEDGERIRGCAEANPSVLRLHGSPRSSAAGDDLTFEVSTDQHDRVARIRHASGAMLGAADMVITDFGLPDGLALE